MPMPAAPSSPPCACWPRRPQFPWRMPSRPTRCSSARAGIGPWRAPCPLEFSVRLSEGCTTTGSAALRELLSDGRERPGAPRNQSRPPRGDEGARRALAHAQRTRGTRRLVGMRHRDTARYVGAVHRVGAGRDRDPPPGVRPSGAERRRGSSRERGGGGGSAARRRAFRCRSSPPVLVGIALSAGTPPALKLYYRRAWDERRRHRLAARWPGRARAVQSRMGPRDSGAHRRAGRMGQVGFPVTTHYQVYDRFLAAFWRTTGDPQRESRTGCPANISALGRPGRAWGAAARRCTSSRGEDHPSAAPSTFPRSRRTIRRGGYLDSSMGAGHVAHPLRTSTGPVPCKVDRHWC